MNILCTCQIKICCALWFFLIAVGSDHLACGIKSDFPKTISDQRADFRSLCLLCTETRIIRTRLETISLKFSKVGKKSSFILIFPCADCCPGQVEGAATERGAGRGQRRSIMPYSCTAPGMCATLPGRENHALGTWVWMGKRNHTR